MLKVTSFIFRRRFKVKRSISTYIENFKPDQGALRDELKEPLIQHLQKRGLISNSTSEDLEELITKSKVGLYCGADPTARSLHLGNLLPLLVLLHFNVRGHHVVGLVGGATGAVGDPSGRTTERDAMTNQTRLDNVEIIQGQLERFFVNGVRYVKSRCLQKNIEEGTIYSRNNYEWWKDVSFLEFLANYGHHIRVGQMLARDSVKSRLESENGIGFNEFTYQVLQAYDFWWLFKNENISVQVGGNDQWGNITAGIDLITRLKSSLKLQHKKDKEIQRLVSKSSFGLTVPLLTTASGEKFGKSSGNAVFIDPKLTPSFELHQYFIKTPDSEVEKLLKIFTILPLSQIKSILEEHAKDPTLRTAQRILAAEVTDLIHGVGKSCDAEIVTSILYPPPDQAYPSISTDILLKAFDHANILKRISKKEFFGKPYSAVVAYLHDVSKSEARKLVANGAVYEGYDRKRLEASDSLLISPEHLIDGEVLLLRVGKGKYYVAQLI